MPGIRWTPLSPGESLHIGRSWADTRLEDVCPCPKQPCGLVASNESVDECEQHPFFRGKTIRQAHPAHLCPGLDSV